MKLDKKNKSALLWLDEKIGKYRIYILVLAVIQIVQGVLAVSFALLLKNLIDVAAATDVFLVKRYFLFLVIVIIIQILLFILSKYLTEDCNSSLENHYKQRIFRGLLYKEYAWLQAVHSGHYAQVLCHAGQC